MIIYIIFNEQCKNKINNIFSKYKSFILQHDNDDNHTEYKKCNQYYIRYFYGNNKLIIIETFNYSYELHKDDGPAIIWYYYNGKIYDKEYYLNGIKYSYDEYFLNRK